MCSIHFLYVYKWFNIEFIRSRNYQTLYLVPVDLIFLFINIQKLQELTVILYQFVI